MAETSQPPPFADAFRFWLKFGWIGFGGPTGQIAILHEELVARRAWISETDFLQGLNYCLMLPGPEAQQLATYLGWRLHGARGALAAGILFFLPAMVILWALSVLYMVAGAVPAVAAAFYGIGPAILAVIVRALLHLARRTLKLPLDLGIAVGAAVLLALLHDNYPLVVLAAVLFGVVACRPPKDAAAPAILPRIDYAALLRTALACIVLWLAPLAAAWLVFGPSSIIVKEGLFFAQTALVTFGGAYVVLPYVTQHAVYLHHWLSAADMLHGISLASGIPGPLVIVTQFVAFVGAWHRPGGMAPLLAATLAALLTSWMTFAPSFFYILIGGPFLRRVLQVRLLKGALRAISAAVVGVMADFAIWFAGHVLFPEQRYDRPDLFAAAATLGCLAVLMRFRLSVPLLLVVGAVLGLIYRLGFSPWR